MATAPQISTPESDTVRSPVANVLAGRYASPEMAELWSAEGKIVLERELWIAVLTAQAQLGLSLIHI